MADAACRSSISYGGTRSRRPPNARIPSVPAILRLLGMGSLMAVGLAACAADEDPPPAADVPDAPLAAPATLADASSSPYPPPKPAPSKIHHAEHHSHKSSPPIIKTAAIEPSALIGKGPGGVAQLLGVPSSASQRDVSLIWIYASADCSFEVYFYPDIKTSLWHALQYASVDKNGDALNPSQVCIQHILTERSSGAN